jgi:hypothetical protein
MAEQPGSSSNSYVRVYSRKKVNFLVRMIVTVLMIATTFMFPVGLLSTLAKSQVAKLVIVFVSILVFPIGIYAISRPKNHDLCMMTAT